MKRYIGGDQSENPPAPEKTEGFTNPLYKMLKGNKLLARAARVSKVSQSALGIIAKAAEPDKEDKLKELESNIKEEKKTLQKMTTRENQRSANEKEKIQKQQKKVDEIQAKIDELEGTSRTGKPSTGTTSGSTGMTKAPMPAM